MYRVRMTFLLRSLGVTVTYLYSYGNSLSYVQRINAYVLRTCGVYVWRMKCTRDVSTAHVYILCSILICGVSVLYQLLLNENKQLCSLCSDDSRITVIKLSKMPPEKSR